MQTKFHTPYDGSSKPYTIALNQLDLADWIEADERLSEYLAEKDRLFREQSDDVFAAEEDTVPAQREVLALLLDHLPARYPDLYQRRGNAITVVPAQRSYDTDAFEGRPLELAARLVQEDLVIMRPGEQGHRLVAAAVCFPSEWCLREKFGKALADVHAPVPGFGRGSRTAGMIERIFSNLNVDQPVERFNWFLLDTPELHYPNDGRPATRMFNASRQPRIWFRVERQTLRRLPASGDILFTIRICIDPFDRLRAHADGPALAAAMRGQIEQLTPGQLAYKGLADECGAILSELSDISSAH